MISKKLCERLGGEITVRSKQGEGSTFSFSVGLAGIKSRAGMPSIRQLECFPHRIPESLTASVAYANYPTDNQLLMPRVYT